MMMKNFFLTLLLFSMSNAAFSDALVDMDVLASVNQLDINTKKPESISVIIFLKSASQTAGFVRDINKMPDVSAQSLHFMPAVLAVIPNNQAVLKQIAQNNAAAQISLNKVRGDGDQCSIHFVGAIHGLSRGE